MRVLRSSLRRESVTPGAAEYLPIKDVLSLLRGPNRYPED